MKTKVFGQHDEATLRQIETCVEAGGERGVLCADGHKGYAQPIGGVVAYKDKISLSGVGFDIACGNLAIRTDAKRHEITPKIGKIMDDVVHEISFGIGRKSKTRVEHELFNDPAWELQPMRGLKPRAAEITTSIFSPMKRTASGSGSILGRAALDIKRQRIF